MNKSSSEILQSALACVVALIITAISLDVAYRSIQDNGLFSTVNKAQGDTVDDLLAIDQAIKEYRDKWHRLPRSLSQLQDVPHRDSWGRSFHYIVQGKNYRVVSYGRNGKPGGTGLDLDLSSTDPGWSLLKTPPSFHQFLFELPTSVMALPCVGAGMLAFVLTIISIQTADLSLRGRASLVGKLLVTIIATLIVAIFMATLETPSGH